MKSFNEYINGYLTIILLFTIQDKNKIRHKKRWSQIMYFYYFLGWELEARDDLSRAQKDKRAENTFCLALGDILFSNFSRFSII